MDKNNIIKIAAWGILLFIQTKGFAQVVTFNELNTYMQKVRIGLVDEFFDRFNGKTTHPDIPASKKNSEINNLMMLYNLSMFTSKNDSLYKEALCMMETVRKDSISIQFSDSTWVALAHCKGTMNGRSIKFDLYLNTQKRKGNMYKWVIARADSKLFDITPRNTNENIMLMPDDHETNFLSMRRMTNEQPFNVNLFMSKDIDYDKTSVFAYLVYSGKLKIDYVDDLEFIFTQIPGYIFHIKYFEREKNNAGWLISNFYRTTDNTKVSFLNTIHPHKKNSVNINEDTTRRFANNKRRVNQFNLQKDELKGQYFLRLNEKILQLKNYVNFMQKDDGLRAQSIYKTKLIDLFAKDAKVYLYQKGELKQKCNSIADFCNMIINKHIVCTSIDSIYVPSWDDKILELKTDVYRYNTPAYLKQIKGNDRNSSTVAPNEKSLYVYKEETEDGIEWLPIFGDIMITIE